ETSIGILNTEIGVNMFNLTKLEHTLRLQPHLLSLPIDEAVKGELEALFLDKVIANLGLCISVYDIESVDGGFIYPNEGAPTYTVKFRLIIFRPFVGEIISATLKESNKDGLRLSLGFFDDIYIPELLMPEPSRADLDPEHKSHLNKFQITFLVILMELKVSADGKFHWVEEFAIPFSYPWNQYKWTWTFNDEKYLIDGYDEIRFRVQNIKFPEIPKEQKEPKPFAPMEIIVSFQLGAPLDHEGIACV
ncbi:hypothetical protein OSB04_004143, partial [Centaurea solstitialis]